MRDVSGFLSRVSRDLLVFLLFISPTVHPWYALPAFALASPARRRNHLAALAVFTATSLIVFYGARMLLEGYAFTKWAKAAKYLLVVLPASLVFLQRNYRKGIPQQPSP